MQDDLIQEISSHIMEYLPKIPTVIVVLVAGVLLIRLLQGMLRRMLEVARVEHTLISFVVTFVKFVCWVFLISLVFSILGFSQISLAFSGSVALVIMGVASNANSLVQDLLAGIFLLAEPEFKEGKTVRLNAVNGSIVGMDIKKTKVQDGEGNIHVIPNRMFDANIYVIENDEVHSEQEEDRTA